MTAILAEPGYVFNQELLRWEPPRMDARSERALTPYAPGTEMDLRTGTFKIATVGSQVGSFTVTAKAESTSPVRLEFVGDPVHLPDPLHVPSPFLDEATIARARAVLLAESGRGRQVTIQRRDVMDREALERSSAALLEQMERESFRRDR